MYQKLSELSNSFNNFQKTLGCISVTSTKNPARVLIENLSAGARFRTCRNGVYHKIVGMANLFSSPERFSFLSLRWFLPVLISSRRDLLVSITVGRGPVPCHVSAIRTIAGACPPRYGRRAIFFTKRPPLIVGRGPVPRHASIYRMIAGLSLPGCRARRDRGGQALALR